MILIKYYRSNVFGIMYVLAGGALAAPPTAPIPYDMHRDLVFSGVICASLSLLVLGLEGKQVRKDMDEQHIQQGEKVAV